MIMDIQFNKVQYKKIYDFFIALILFAAMEFVYSVVEVGLFAYAGYVFSFDFSRFILGWLLFIVCSYVVIMFSSETLSAALYSMLFFLSIAPFIVLYQFDSAIKIWMLIYQIVLLFFIMMIVRVLEELYFRHKHESFKSFDIELQNKMIRQIVMVFIGVVLLFFVFKKGIPSLTSMDFSNVYETRGSVSFSSFELMAMTLICKILIPIYLSYYLDEKKYVMAGYLSIVQVYMYAVTGYKTYILMLGLIYAFSIFRKTSYRRLILLGLLALFTGGLVLYLLSGSAMLAAIIFNRLVFLPAKIKWAYFDFFSFNPFLMFSQSTIGGIFNIPQLYDTNICYLIGDIYFNKPEMWTNTGFMADAYSNMGILGGFLLSFVLAIEVFLIDVVTGFNNRTSGAVVFLMYFVSLNDGGLISVSVSGGLLLSILFFAIIARRKINEA